MTRSGLHAAGKARHAVRALALALLLTATTGAPAAYEWAVTATPIGLPTQPQYAEGLVVQAIAGTLYLHRPENGGVAATYVASGIRRTPPLVMLGDPIDDDQHRYVFLAGSDGQLVKLDVPGNLLIGTVTLQPAVGGGGTQVVDLRRPACLSEDSLIAEPVVQRAADSNASYTLQKDIVMVATAHGCGDTTQNQIVALDAEDVRRPPVWVFNVGEYEVAKFRACALDLERSLLHCGAEHPEGSSQYALWSIDTNTGGLAWAALSSVGVHAKPVLGAAGTPYSGRLYVGDQDGFVHAFEAQDGTAGPSVPIVPPVIGEDPAVDLDLASGRDIYAGMVYATGSSGKLTALYDVGDELIAAWDTSFAGGQRVVTPALPVDGLGLVYVGTSDGTVRQLSQSNGADDAYGLIGNPLAAPATRESMSLGLYAGADGYARVVGSLVDTMTGGITVQYRVPCEVGSTTCDPAWLGFGNGFEDP